VSSSRKRGGITTPFLLVGKSTKLKPSEALGPEPELEPEEQPELVQQEPQWLLERRSGNQEPHKRRKPALGSKVQEHCNRSNACGDHGNGRGNERGMSRCPPERHCNRSTCDRTQLPSFHRQRGRFQQPRETTRFQTQQNDSF
jgi:hypothetical protein